VKEISGLQIGLVGIASNIVGKTMPPSYSEGLEFTLGREELPPIIDVLRAQERVDLIIFISHLGFPQDMKLLSEVQGIDICLSGHVSTARIRSLSRRNACASDHKDGGEDIQQVVDHFA
jgi:S-sulfosulfanyl-L-cysteine sulfohydrolase